MKIAFLTWEYPSKEMGGSGVYAKNITEGLAKNGHKVYVFTPFGYSRDVNNLKHIHVPYLNIKILKLITFWINLLFTLLLVSRKIKGFDIIHVNGYVDFLLFKSMFPSVPRVTTVHHLAIQVLESENPNIIERIKNLGREIGITPILEKFSINRSDSIIAVSHDTKINIIKRYKVPSNKIVKIYNGIEWKPYKETKRNKDRKSKIMNLLFLGRLERRKGLGFLLETMKYLKHSKRFSFQLNVVGSGNANYYKKLSKKLNINKMVNFKGFLKEKDLEEIFNYSDIFILPSKIEGFGLVILEAINKGLPVICTNRGGMVEIVKDYNMGYIIEYGDEKELAETIIDVSKKIMDGKLPISNIAKIEEKYNWNKNVKNLVKEYKKIISKKALK